MEMPWVTRGRTCRLVGMQQPIRRANAKLGASDRNEGTAAFSAAERPWLARTLAQPRRAEQAEEGLGGDASAHAASSGHSRRLPTPVARAAARAVVVERPCVGDLRRPSRRQFRGLEILVASNQGNKPRGRNRPCPRWPRRGGCHRKRLLCEKMHPPHATVHGQPMGILQWHMQLVVGCIAVAFPVGQRRMANGGSASAILHDEASGDGHPMMPPTGR